eukprot:10183026-Lingulodinium_polyedra.AAC.1
MSPIVSSDSGTYDPMAWAIWARDQRKVDGANPDHTRVGRCHCAGGAGARGRLCHCAAAAGGQQRLRLPVSRRAAAIASERIPPTRR